MSDTPPTIAENPAGLGPTLTRPPVTASRSLIGVGGTAMYRCRLCGNVYNGTHVPDVLRYAGKAITNDVNATLPGPSESMAPHLIETHVCRKTAPHIPFTIAVGIADLIGFTVDPEEKL